MKKNILFDSDLDIPIDKSAPETFDESTFEQLCVLVNSEIDKVNRQFIDHNIKTSPGNKLAIASNILVLAKQQYILNKMFQEYLVEINKE